MPEVDRVLGNQEKLIKKNFSCLSTEKVNVAPGPINCLIPCAPLISFPGKAKAFLKIQNGCNHFCTFCATRLARGPSQSVPMEDVLKQARHFIENGIKEIILTGIDIASYGRTLADAPTLADLIHDLLTKLPDLPRLRISSIDSIEIDEKLFELLISKHSIMPHLHLSLQSGDNTILSKMKRRHTREEAIEICMKLKQARPEFVFGADFIIGFPGETEKMFQNTLNLVENAGITFLHLFSFSLRPGTLAAQMPQLPRSLIKERMLRFKEKKMQILQNHLKHCQKKKVQVLVEKNNKGYSQDFTHVKFLQDIKDGSLIDGKVIGNTEDTLLATSLL